MSARRFHMLGLAAAAAAAAVLAAPAAAKAADEVKFSLDWVLNGTHAGYFTALAKGYYRDAGLDVTISRGFGSGDTVKRVGSGAATFGVADTGTVIASIANEDIPVRIVAMIYQKATLGLIYLEASGIKKPQDLEGRTIGRSASGASVTMFPGFLKANNIERSKIHEVVVDGATYLPLLLSRKVDAVLEQSVQLGHFKKAAAAQGQTAIAMRYSDYGLAAYGNAIIANPEHAQGQARLGAAFRGRDTQGGRLRVGSSRRGRRRDAQDEPRGRGRGGARRARQHEGREHHARGGEGGPRHRQREAHGRDARHRHQRARAQAQRAGRADLHDGVPAQAARDAGQVTGPLGRGWLG